MRISSVILGMRIVRLSNLDTSPTRETSEFPSTLFQLDQCFLQYCKIPMMVLFLSGFLLPNLFGFIYSYEIHFSQEDDSFQPRENNINAGIAILVFIAIFEENHITDPPNQSNTTSSILPSNLATHTHSIPHCCSHLPLPHLTATHREKLRVPALLSKTVSMASESLPGELNSHHLCQSHLCAQASTVLPA